MDLPSLPDADILKIFEYMMSSPSVWLWIVVAILFRMFVDLIIFIHDTIVKRRVVYVLAELVTPLVVVFAMLVGAYSYFYTQFDDPLDLPLLDRVKQVATVCVFPCCIMSVYAFLLMSADKWNAVSNGGSGNRKQDAWRVPERMLHLSELFGGSFGSFFAQRLLRHKVSKSNYQITFWLIVAVQLFLFIGAVPLLLDWLIMSIRS